MQFSHSQWISKHAVCIKEMKFQLLEWLFLIHQVLSV